MLKIKKLINIYIYIYKIYIYINEEEDKYEDNIYVYVYMKKKNMRINEKCIYIPRRNIYNMKKKDNIMHHAGSLRSRALLLISEPLAGTSLSGY